MCLNQGLCTKVKMLEEDSMLNLLNMCLVAFVKKRLFRISLGGS